MIIIVLIVGSRAYLLRKGMEIPTCPTHCFCCGCGHGCGTTVEGEKTEEVNGGWIPRDTGDTKQEAKPDNNGNGTGAGAGSS